MKIALASPPYPKSIADGLYWVEKLIKDAVTEQAEIICFPESYIPGYPGLGFVPEERTPQNMQSALAKVCELAAENNIAVIMPMDWYDNDVLLNVAYVILAGGEVLGYQTKNQLDPSEDAIWVPGTARSIFEVDGKVRHHHLSRRFPLSRVCTVGSKERRQNSFPPSFSGERCSGGRIKGMGRCKQPLLRKSNDDARFRKHYLFCKRKLCNPF